MGHTDSTCSSPGAGRPASAVAGRHVFICVNGILNRPGASDGWTDRAVTWLHINTSAHAEKFEYAAGALTRRWFQQQRAEAIARMCDFYVRAGFSISFIGHSNGCDLIARVLALRPRLEVRSIHLVAAAADWAPFGRALCVGRIFLYVSANDRALALASLSRDLAGWAGLGYGDLGRDVPAEALQDPRVAVIRRDNFGHSDWWTRGERFETTMQLITVKEQVDLPLAKPLFQ